MNSPRGLWLPVALGIVLGFVSQAWPAGRYTLAFWREAGAYENQAPPAGEFGNHSAFVHIWDENGQPLAGKQIYTSWGVLLGTTDADGFTEIVLNRPNGYDFQIRDGAHQTDTTPVLSVERPPTWGHYSFEIGFVFKANTGNAGLFDTDSFGTINASGTDPCRDLSTPHTRSLAYYSTAASNYCSDAYALGTWTASHGQTFVATGNRIIALKAFMAAGYGVHFYWTAQILEGGPSGTPMGPPRSTRLLVDGEYYPILVKWGVNDVQVVPGRTYYFKITRDTGVNVYRVNRDNYGGGNYFENGTPVPGSELMGLVVCGTFTNSGPVGALAGLVRDAQNNPLGGALVSVPDTALYSTTDGSGAFAIPFIPAGTYAVTASKAGYVMKVNSGVAITAGQTNTTSFQLSVESTNSTGLILTPSYVLQPFESAPAWNSTFDAAWGSAATFASVSPGQTGNALQVTRGGPGSSARVMVFPVKPNTAYELAVWARCPSFGSAYWAECAYRFGNNTAQDFDGNAGAWTLIKKFSDTGANGNGNVWTRYTASFNSGGSTQISIGFKLGAATGTGPIVQWDQLSLVSLALPPVTVAVAETPTNVTVRFPEPVSEATATNLANYRLRNGSAELTLLNATLFTPSNVTLLTLQQSLRTDYTLSVSNVLLPPQPASLTGLNGQLPVRAVRRLKSIDGTAQWKYDAGGVNLGTAWRLPGYDDTAWAEGAPLFGSSLGALPAPLRTAVAPVANRWTTYYRTRLVLPARYSNAWLRIHPVVDDAAVFWLNGTEAFRLGVTNTTVAYSTPASRLVGLPAAEGPFDITAPALLPGTNLLAVELHQADANDPDLIFGASMDALVLLSQMPPDNVPLSLTRDTDSMVLTWPEPTMTLQSSTNIAGPWFPWPGAASPLPISSTNAARFFRLAE